MPTQKNRTKVALLTGPAGSFQRSLKQGDHDKTRDLMSHYYHNLGLMSALLIAISFTIMVELDEEAEDEAWKKTDALVGDGFFGGRRNFRLVFDAIVTGSAVAGVTSFGFLLGCVVESIMIDNGITKCVTAEDLQKFIERHPFYLSWPMMLFITGLATAMLNFFLWIVSKFSIAVAVYTLVGGIVFFIVLVARCVEQSTFFSELDDQAAVKSDASKTGARVPGGSKTMH